MNEFVRKDQDTRGRRFPDQQCLRTTRLRAWDEAEEIG